MIGISYRAPEEVSGAELTANNASLPGRSSTKTVGASSVNDVVAANIAANMAMSSDMSIADSVANLAVSIEILSKFEQVDGSSVQKPTIIELTAGSKSIISYTTKSGDTVQSVAKHFGISEQTLKWANDLTGDTLVIGSVLEIPPINGVVYIVRAGDTAASIASRYQSDASRIISYNNLEISGIRAGQKIVLPGGILPVNERPGYYSPYSSYGFSGGESVVVGNIRAKYGVDVYNSSPGNTFGSGLAYINNGGQCTWWVYERLKAMGRPLPRGAILGNAGYWDYSLVNYYGYHVRGANVMPKVGDIMQNGIGTVSTTGHVSVVERINKDNSIVVSEMNYPVAGVVTERTIPAYAIGFAKYIYK